MKTRRLGRVKRRCDVYLAFCEIVRFGVVVGRRWSPAAWERLPQTRKAIVFAERMHAGQERSDGSPFVLHPMEVGSLLYYAGAPDHVIAAGVMHDLIEKAGVSVADIRTQFGARIAGLVRAVSDDDSIEGYTRRKAALRRQVAGAGGEALSLFAADKLSKVRDLRREAAAESEDGVSGRRRQVRARRLGHYQRSLAMLEERLPASPLVSELRDEFGLLTRELREPKLVGSR